MKWKLWKSEKSSAGRVSGQSPTRQAAADADAEGNYVKAIGIWRTLAEMGDPVAIFEVGTHYEAGHGVLQSFVEAASWYHKAAEAGSLSAIAKLGDIYFSGREPPLTISANFGSSPANVSGSAFANLAAQAGAILVNFAEAAKWNRRAAEAGDLGSQIRWAYQCAGGLGVEVDFGAAEHWFAVAAGANDPQAQFGMGLLYAGGNGRPKDHPKAEHWLERAADQGHPAAKVCLAVLLTQGHHPTKDYVKAARHLKEAAEAQNREAMFLYGEYRRFGIGCAVDESEAESWLRRAAIKGHVGAMTAAASMLRSQKVPDYASAAALYRDAADLGDGAAQFALGELYVAGSGVPKDAQQAALWFERAADRGVVAAYQRLGAMYADGLGLQQDFEAAATWFGRAAEGGKGAANYDIAALHHYGLGVSADPQKALAHYRLAEKDGDPRAVLRLGILHAQGELVDQDYAIAADYYHRAANMGSAEAKLNLAFLMIRELGGAGSTAAGEASLVELGDSGQIEALWALYRLYSEGVYVSENKKEADKWLVKAATSGSAAAALELGRRLQVGDKSPVSVKETITILEQAAKSGHASAQSMLGRILFEGVCVERDLSGALIWLTRAANHGDTFAQAWLGDVLSTGQGVLIDRKAAAGWYRSAAKQGHAGALMALTAMYSTPESDKSEQQIIFDLWLRPAEAGDPLAQRMIGDFYTRGIGCERSAIDGAIWLRKACALGNNAAKVILAGVLLKGQAPALDQGEPIRLLHEAAGAGNADAEYNLGVCFKVGLGVPQSLDSARFWYRAAADHGHASAQLALADLLLEGQDNYPEALRLYTAAAAAGLPGASFGLGRIHEEGFGVPRNKGLALTFYKRAAQAGLEPAKAAVARYSSAQKITH